MAQTDLHLEPSSPWVGLEGYDIVLGSQSPRRVELLRGLDLPFRQMAMPDLDESYPEGLTPSEVVGYIARAKADAYAQAMRPDTLLITADTIVDIGGRILGKPRDRAEAVEVLRLLSGATHEVHTGVCIATVKSSESFVCTTRVHFDELTDGDIAYYLDRYEPYDKAGAYGIQEWIGYRGIRGIEGSFYNVMGLPVHQLARRLSALPPLG